MASPTTWIHRSLPAAATALSTLLITVSAATITVHADDTSIPVETRCPVLYVLGVQGSDEGAPATGIDSDTGALGQVFGPLTAAAAGDMVQRAYVPYGHDSQGQVLDYEAAVTDATERLERMVGEVVTRCPNTGIAAAGYAQGASAVARFAHRVGSGESTIAPDRVAAIALLAHPGRAADTPVLPGRPGAGTPAGVPGTTGQQVSAISLLDQPLTGAGIAASRSPSDYGTLSGRVADLCVVGDATCDVPAGGALAASAVDVAARSDLRDPVAALATIAEALATTVYTAAVGVVNEDLTGTSLDELSYQPVKPIAQRLAEAADPTATPPGPNEALAALFKVGTIGLNAVMSLARTVLTPATLAELATVGMANPWAAVALIAAKLTGAVVELVPPQTVSRWVNEAFEAITSTITDPGELYTLAGAAQYSATIGRHGSYRTAPVTSTGRSAFAVTADWFTAVARDLAAAGLSTVSPPSAVGSSASVPASSPAVTVPPSPSGGP